MSKFDDFIEATDKDLNIDTGTRINKGYLTPPMVKSAETSSGSNSVNPDGIRLHRSQKQITPKKLSSQDHPLRADNSREGHERWRSTSKLNKRRSLIQPIVAPKTPELSCSQIKGININNSAPAALKEDIKRDSSTDREKWRHYSPKSPSLEITDGSNDISLILQQMANKELELLEGKHRIEELKKKLATEEKAYKEHANELEELKEYVGSKFQYNTGELSSSPTPMKSQQSAVYKTSSNDAIRKQMPQNEPDKNAQSVWSKPLALFNQFDQIIQQELEKTLNWDEPIRQDNHSDANIATRNSRTNDQSIEVRQSKPEEQSVTRSIWNFVSDMKTGLLGVEEGEEQPEYSQKTHTENTENNENSKTISAKESPSVRDVKKASGTVHDNEDTCDTKNKLEFVGENLEDPTGNESEVRSQEVEMHDF